MKVCINAPPQSTSYGRVYNTLNAHFRRLCFELCVRLRTVSEAQGAPARQRPRSISGSAKSRLAEILFLQLAQGFPCLSDLSFQCPRKKLLHLSQKIPLVSRRPPCHHIYIRARQQRRLYSRAPYSRVSSWSAFRTYFLVHGPGPDSQQTQVPRGKRSCLSRMVTL
jgi:hypothetical protein